MQRRTSTKGLTKTPPLPKSEPPLNDPPYEVIEFPPQQYSNTTLLFGDKKADDKKDKRKCDLCGSSNAQYHCEICAQQAFCVSCDQMYHRHPKRQNHIRKRLPIVYKPRTEGQPPIPPIPPKGEAFMAPVPPPRRNKRATKAPTAAQPETFKKNGSIMGSLKRFVGGIQPVSSPFQPKAPRNEQRPAKFTHSLHSAEFDPQSLRREGGYLGWELQNRHRSGSFAALNGPGFSPMIQAQSMAQLNCPSCHHHGGVSGWDWNRSQMNLNTPFQQPWPGMSTGTWHGSVMFPPPYRVGPENFSDHSSGRRSSLRSQRYHRRPSKFDNEDDSDSELSLSDDRKSHRRSPAIREASPALSRRSRRTVVSDTEDDTMSRKSDRRFKRRVPASRDPSPGVFRRGYRSRRPDDDAVSTKSASSRKSRRSPVNQKLGQGYLRKNVARSSSSDSDDELTSDRDVNGDRNTSNSNSESAPVRETKNVGKMSHITKAAVTQKTKVAEKVKNYEQMRMKSDTKEVKNSKCSDDVDDWECGHCTYLNPASAKVCDVCCKSKVVSEKPAEEAVVESMKTLSVSTTDDQKKKDDEPVISKVSAATKTSTGTSPPPQSASTQTYEVPSVVAKRNRSLSFDDYSDWNPNKKSSSAASFTSDTNQSLAKPESSQSSQSPILMDAVLQKQMKDSLEIVKLLKDAEKNQFTPDDLTVALMHCGESNPVKWLLENWNQMIDTVVTLATNYGHEQAENTIGTISSHEAKSALHSHNGDIWAAATECIRQRQRKYTKLMSKGSFNREDVVTVLTANHGDIEAAYMELRKSQLKPFLMKIWGPPQGLDNDCGNTLKYEDKYLDDESTQEPALPKDTLSWNNYNFVQSWLQSAHATDPDDTDLVDFIKLKNNVRKYASAFYLNTQRLSSDSVKSEVSLEEEDVYSDPANKDAYLRYRSCENLNLADKRVPTFRKRFHKSSESLFHNRTKPNGEFFLHDLNCRFINRVSSILDFDPGSKLYQNDHKGDVDKQNVPDQENENEILVHSLEENHLNSDGIEHQNISSSEDQVETDSLDGSVSPNAQSYSVDHQEKSENLIDQGNYDGIITDEVTSSSALSITQEHSSLNLLEESERTMNRVLFDELKALYCLAKKNLEFLIISNNDASIEVESPFLVKMQYLNDPAGMAFLPEAEMRLLDTSLDFISSNKMTNPEMITKSNSINENSITNDKIIDSRQIKTELISKQSISSESMKSLESDSVDEATDPEVESEKAPVPDDKSVDIHSKVFISTDKVTNMRFHSVDNEIITQPIRSLPDHDLLDVESSLESDTNGDSSTSESEMNSYFDVDNIDTMPQIKVDSNDAVTEPEMKMYSNDKVDDFSKFNSTDKVTSSLKIESFSNDEVSDMKPKMKPISDNEVTDSKLMMNSTCDKTVTNSEQSSESCSSNEVPNNTESMESYLRNEVTNSEHNSNAASITKPTHFSGSQPNLTKNYLAKAYIEINPSPGPPNHLPVTNVNEAEPVQPNPSDEDFHSYSDDNFEDVDYKESTDSNFITENDDSSSEIDEDRDFEEDQPQEYVDEVFNEALAENIKEFIRQESADKSEEIGANRIQPIEPISLKSPAKPVHIIRINVPDELINAPKRNHESIDVRSYINNESKDLISDKTGINFVRSDKTHKDIEHVENPRVNLAENHINGKENKANGAENGLDIENKSSPDSTEEHIISEYVREIHIVKDTNTDTQIGVPDEAKQSQRVQDGYVSDSSVDSFKTEVKNCLSQGLTKYDQAVLAAQLIKLKFDRSQSLDAATECSSIQAAITYLQQDCQLCADKVSIKQMISMLECEHRCCQNCAEQFFSLQILEKSIVDCVCPFCKQPEISKLDADEVSLYFSNLDILLKTILQPKVHELFQQKLRDRTLMQDPNFKWCSECSSGFIAEPGQTRVLCPDCKSISCAQCGKLWDKEHDGKTCEQYNSWLSKNNVNSQLSQYLEDFGVTCPKCDTKFILVKGGCMHLTCSSCKYEFCSDCMKPFCMGSDCKISEYCAKLGLHAHHPRNCLFYLRDKEPGELKQLLKENNVELNLPLSENARCDVPLQKETEEGLIDTRCGARVEEAGYCRSHLREHLSRIICRLRLETIDILTCDDLETIVIREGKKRPPRGYNTPENEYYKALYQLLLQRDCVILRRTHFVEYLTALIRKNKVDPVAIFDLAEMLQEFRRRGKSLPIRPANMFEYEYRRLCVKVIKEEMPIE